MPGEDWPYKGARWWKFDFHTHTPFSRDTPWHGLIGTANELTPELWLKAFMDAGVHCVAVTDHNGGGWVDRLKQAYVLLEQTPPDWFRPLHLFPGVEISVNGGFHILAIFEKNKSSADIDHLLGRVDYAGDKGDSNGVTRESPVRVIEEIHRAGGLAIPAHADGAKGILQMEPGPPPEAVIDANTLKQVIDCPSVVAVEVVDRSAPRPPTYEQSGRNWTQVLGSDCHNLRGPIVPGVRWTWIKMGQPSLDGLRLALLDGQGFSVRRSDEGSFDPLQLPSRFIESIEVNQAYVMGNGAAEHVHFNPAFTALVGGRGTGKSTIVHCLRYPLQRDGDLEVLDESNHARQTFINFNRVAAPPDNVGGLRNATKVVVTYSRDGERYRLTWRQGQEATTVEEWHEGAWRTAENQLVSEERFPVRIMSQGQLVTLAKDTGALLKLIDESAGLRTDHEHIETHTNRYLRLQAEVRELQERLRNQPAAQLAFDDVNRRLEAFEAHGGAEAVTEFRRRDRQRTLIQLKIDTTRQLANNLDQVPRTDVSPIDPDGMFNPEDPADAAAAAVLDRLARSRIQIDAALHTMTEQLRTAANDAETELGSSSWAAGFDQARTRFEEATRQLAQQGTVQEGEIDRLLEQRRDTEEQLALFARTQADSASRQADATAALESLRQARRELSVHRELFLAEHLADNPLVRITIQKYGRDKHAIERSLRAALNIEDGRFQDDMRSADGQGRPVGIVNALLADLPEIPEVAANEIEAKIARFKQQITLACRGETAADLGGHFRNYLRREFQQRPEFLDRVLSWFPEDSFHLEYSRAGDGRDFHEIVQASDGQRAATMLAFLLAFGTDPFVIDQPEDDLDNTLIYGLIVRQIREKKGTRQIIAVTHNPNVVVNGDAEHVNVLDYRRGQCRVVEHGCLQEQPVREEVCRVLEGGREAFSKRYKRLGSP